MKKILLVTLMVNFIMFYYSSVVFSDGNIIVNNDEWTLSDAGFQRAQHTKQFVLNIANLFGNGGKGNFLVYSSNFGLTQKTLAATMKNAGHTWVVNKNEDFSLSNIKLYNGIFLAGEAANNSVLIEYVKSGGNIYLAGGTGWGGSRSEANRWNEFLNFFGLHFKENYNGVDAVNPIQSSNIIFKNVNSLYYNNGNSIIELTDTTKKSMIIDSRNGNGLIALYSGNSMLTGCVQLLDKPLKGAKALLIQSGEIHQNSVLNESGCYNFQKVNTEKSFSIIIRKIVED